MSKEKVKFSNLVKRAALVETKFEDIKVSFEKFRDDMLDELKNLSSSINDLNNKLKNYSVANEGGKHLVLVNDQSGNVVQYCDCPTVRVYRTTISAQFPSEEQNYYYLKSPSEMKTLVMLAGASLTFGLNLILDIPYGLIVRITPVENTQPAYANPMELKIGHKGQLGLTLKNSGDQTAVIGPDMIVAQLQIVRDCGLPDASV